MALARLEHVQETAMLAGFTRHSVGEGCTVTARRDLNRFALSESFHRGRRSFPWLDMSLVCPGVRAWLGRGGCRRRM